ncbi:MAG: TatD family hydrolase [Thermovirgaceae bacterium]|nr:TatD family hydrolase [Thermovirgaceae bacterium]
MERLADTHCHLAMEDFAGDLAETLERACIAGVEKMLIAGSDEKASIDAFGLVSREKSCGLFVAVGIHPHDSNSASGGIPRSVSELALDPAVAAVGETGLDYFYDHSPREIQKEVFVLHAALARECAKPLVVHVRDAYDDAIEILRRERASECGGVIHCFSGEMHHARAAIDLGFYISFAGPLTYPKNETLRKIASELPLERILCETDSPYLSPQPRRGKRNEPANVRFVYEELARVRGISVEECAEAVWKNALRLFGWGDQ